MSGVDAILPATIPSTLWLRFIIEPKNIRSRIALRASSITPLTRIVPIPFPWKRAIPGILLAGGVFGWGTVEFVREGLVAMRAVEFTPPVLSSGVILPLEQAGWVALALVASLLSWMLSKRLAGRSGLL